MCHKKEEKSLVWKSYFGQKRYIIDTIKGSKYWLYVPIMSR